MTRHCRYLVLLSALLAVEASGVEAKMITVDEHISCQDFCGVFSNKDTTQLRKDQLFSLVKDKQVTWTGTLVEVSDGTFTGLTLQLKCWSDTLSSDVVVSGFPQEERPALLALRNGQKVTVTGKLTRWGQIMQHSITDAHLVTTTPTSTKKTKKH